MKVNMARDYERANDWRVHEYLPHTFDVGEFRQRFPGSKHAEVIKELDEKVAELDRNRREGKTTFHAWVGQLSGWLQPVLACLPFKSGNHPSHGCREKEIRSVGSTGNGLNDGKVYSRMSQQPMLLQRTSTGQSSPQVVSVERANIVSTCDLESPRLASLSIFSAYLQLRRATFRFRPTRPIYRKLEIISRSRTAMSHDRSFSLPSPNTPSLTTCHLRTVPILPFL